MIIHNRQILFNGLIIDIEQMEVEIGACGRHIYQVVRHPGGAGVLPVHDDGTISLIRQVRPAVETAQLEIPAGRLDPSEPPIRCASRELREETGLVGGTLISLGMIYSSPGVFDEAIHLFAATGITDGAACPEADEEIEVLRLPFDEALKMAADGRISDAKTLAALLRWELLCRT
ncbi:NUDIX hydrolase [Geobacter sp. SVR]|uniref:NUDIX hydrolase n=1 Tax=Geobacter sp. SVR TaxID=2495594 RepID=UPI00143EFFBC|nr:NUDIX hydrolase [Geobacter sp. SVR]BCS55477.1 ADP-ribose pyrophosphatase [Geobacter sp. SVR]GCF83480.1 ADP-ribose pyrophosphatase [Geobacter sp. SVR]